MHYHPLNRLFRELEEEMAKMLLLLLVATVVADPNGPTDWPLPQYYWEQPPNE
jgi:hypothetical protein